MRGWQFVLAAALCIHLSHEAWAQRPGGGGGGGCQRGGGGMTTPVPTTAGLTMLPTGETATTAIGAPGLQQLYGRRSPQYSMLQMQQLLAAQQMQRVAKEEADAQAIREQERQRKLDARKQRLADELAKREASKAKTRVRRMTAQK